MTSIRPALMSPYLTKYPKKIALIVALFLCFPAAALAGVSGVYNIVPSPPSCSFDGVTMTCEGFTWTGTAEHNSFFDIRYCANNECSSGPIETIGSNLGSSTAHPGASKVLTGLGLGWCISDYGIEVEAKAMDVGDDAISLPSHHSCGGDGPTCGDNICDPGDCSSDCAALEIDYYSDGLAVYATYAATVSSADGISVIYASVLGDVDNYGDVVLDGPFYGPGYPATVSGELMVGVYPAGQYTITTTLFDGSDTLVKGDIDTVTVGPTTGAASAAFEKPVESNDLCWNRDFWDYNDGESFFLNSVHLLESFLPHLMNSLITFFWDDCVNTEILNSFRVQVRDSMPFRQAAQITDAIEAATSGQTGNVVTVTLPPICATCEAQTLVLIDPDAIAAAFGGYPTFDPVKAASIAVSGLVLGMYLYMRATTLVL